MENALDNYVIRGEIWFFCLALRFMEGVKHNIPLLRDVIQQEKFVEGDITTNFLAETYPDGFPGFRLTDDNKKQLVSAAVFFYTTRQMQDQAFINQKYKPDSIFYRPDLVVDCLGEKYPVTVNLPEATEFPLTLEFLESNQSIIFDNVQFTSGNPVLNATCNNIPFTLQLLSQHNSSMKLSFFGTEFDVTVRTQEEQK